MKKQVYAIATPKHSNQKYLDESAFVTTWHPELSFGTYDSSMEAKRSFVLKMHGLAENIEYADEFIRRHFKVFQYQKQAKIVKITVDE